MKYLSKSSAVIFTILALLIFSSLPALAGEAAAGKVAKGIQPKPVVTTTDGSPKPFKP